MALTVEQNTKATNGLSQTFSNTYGATPTEGNLLIAFLWHDETSADIADLTSSGWVRMQTAVGTLQGLSYRIHIFCKFAGASESTTVSWDLGEVNRRAHGYAVEISDPGVTQLNPVDSADSEEHVNSSPGTSNQVDNPITIGSGQIGLVMVGLNGASIVPPTWATEITLIDNWSNNFRGSAIGYTEPATVQPTATWGTSRANLQMIAAVGVAAGPVPQSKVLKGSSFQVRPAA